jgi:hypothetical protein
MVPGSGEINVKGDYREQGILSITLKKKAFPSLCVEGKLQLGGVLAVVLSEGLVPDVGDSFEIITCKSSTGRFGELKLPNLVGGRSWDVSYGESAVKLKVVEDKP